MQNSVSRRVLGSHGRSYLKHGRVESVAHLASVGVHGGGHDSLQVTTEAHSLHRDDGFLSQHRSSENTRTIYENRDFAKHDLY